MSLEEFQNLRALQDRRVRMTFNDGQVLTATLVSISTDLDSSRHIVYDRIEGAASTHPDRAENVAYYAAGEDLFSCVPCESDT